MQKIPTEWTSYIKNMIVRNNKMTYSHKIFAKYYNNLLLPPLF